ncbi:hypothetical protein SKAU_G00324510 [Synaphobranchus kaupii]|uniref:Uncharacterized protein n=1 Tax=Synaphobranchus kaupii TaxID=118154 RepID=A0A9Q1IHZ7_SYNKA|nr:hypothetical protein SKAU_G00324510 [Synaphobranchus kaupii]
MLPTLAKGRRYRHGEGSRCRKTQTLLRSEQRAALHREMSDPVPYHARLLNRTSEMSLRSTGEPNRITSLFIKSKICE